MGLEPYMITATLEAVVAQRLVRHICERCHKEFAPTEDMLMELNLRPADVRGKRFAYGPGCDACNNTGFKGRMAIFELLIMDDDIREIIMNQGLDAGHPRSRHAQGHAPPARQRAARDLRRRDDH